VGERVKLRNIKKMMVKINAFNVMTVIVPKTI
jgi:hypothetical protein